MYQSEIRTIVASIVLAGHFSIFAIALSFGLLKVVLLQDAFDLALMSSPVLSVTALAALLFILDNETNRKRGKKVTKAFSTAVIAIPAILLISLSLIFTALIFQFRDFGPDQAKIALGATETFFGGYLGAISKKLFGSD